METIYMRDLDGTGSYHPCAEEDDGSVKFISTNAHEELVAKVAMYESERTNLLNEASIIIDTILKVKEIGEDVALDNARKLFCISQVLGNALAKVRGDQS